MATDRSGARQFGSKRPNVSSGQQVRGVEVDLASLQRQLADLKASQPQTTSVNSAAKPWWLPRSGG
jgi:hypothetical protein